MKKYAIYLLLICLAGLIGCEKEMFLDQTGVEKRPTANPDHYTLNRKNVPQYAGVSKMNDMIRFDDINSFERAFRLMESEDDLINDRFITDWGHLTEDKLEEKEQELGFHEDLAMIYFENLFGHQSLRAKIETLEASWLSSAELNPDLDPNNHVIHDRILKTFFNEDSELMIGESIYKVMQNGVVYEVKDGDAKTADQISLVHAAMPFVSPNVIIHNAELLGNPKSLFGTCRILPSGRSGWQYYNGGSRRYRAYLGLRNFAFYTGTLSTNTSYRLVKGKWKKRRGSLKTRNSGHVSLGSTDCTGQKTAFNSKLKSKYRRHVEKRYVFYFGVPNPAQIARCESGWLTSYHYCNGSDIDFTLIW